MPTAAPQPVSEPIARPGDTRQFDETRFPAAFDPRIADIPEPIGLPALPPPPPSFNNTRFAGEDDGGHAALAETISREPVFSQTRFDEGFRNIPHSTLPRAGDERSLAASRALDASNFAIAGQSDPGVGAGGGSRTGSPAFDNTLSGEDLPGLIPEGTPTFELPFDGVDIPLPVGLAPLFDGEGGGAIGRPKSIFAQLGLPELSAQAQRNLIPEELEAFKQLARLTGVGDNTINRRLDAQRTGGGQRTRRISSAGGSF